VQIDGQIFLVVDPLRLVSLTQSHLFIPRDSTNTTSNPLSACLVTFSDFIVRDFVSGRYNTYGVRFSILGFQVVEHWNWKLAQGRSERNIHQKITMLGQGWKAGQETGGRIERS